MRRVQEKVEREVQALERELRHELPKEIERATALGDLRENAEYHSALERQTFVRARIAQLKERLSQLSTMSVAKLPRDRAGFGSVVTVRDLDDESTRVFELVLGEEGDPGAGKISVSSPIGRS
ncbi:MAG: GreA/GreB family elongation factor, partial [Acidobacteriota bacterium]|nr:GreA/GreB family elongation factor [Acidobacteriota bacterium]